MVRYTLAMSSFHILIIGGGFTGLEVARRLSRQPNTRITLIDTQSHALFTPRLVDALAGFIPEREYHLPHAEIAARRGYTFIQGLVTHLDPAKKEVTVSLGESQEQTIAFDASVCALGARTAFFGLKGQEHVYPLKTWNQLLALEEKLRETANTTHPRIAVVGGGATGVEAAVALHERLTALGCPIGKRAIEIYQAAPQILPGFLPATVKRAADELERCGINIHTNATVVEARAHSLLFKSGDEHAADLILWAPGVEANSLAATHLPHDDRGALLPDHNLRVTSGIFAGGDIITLREGQRTVPKNAQTAMKMGAHIAHNILRERTGKSLRSFAYRSPGVMLWLGRTSIADMFGLSLPSSFFTFLRDLFYRFRWWQLTK